MLGGDTFTCVPASDFDRDGRTDPTKYDSSTHTLSWLNSNMGTWISVDLVTGTFSLAIGQ